MSERLLDLCSHLLAAAAQTVLTQSNAASLSIPLRQFVDLGSAGSLGLGQTGPGLIGTFNALELINGAAMLSNHGKQATINLGAMVPGVLSLTLDVSTGEPMQQSNWTKIGSPGATLYTAQTRLRLVATVGGTGLLAGVSIRLPIYMEVAYARGTLASVSCPGGDIDNATVGIKVSPGVAHLWIGDVTTASLTNFTSSPVVNDASIINTAVIKTTGSANATVSDVNETELDFSKQNIDQQTIKSTSTQNFGQSLTQSLIQNLSLNVNIVGLSLLSPAIVKPLVATALGAIAAPIDSVLSRTLTLLGIHLGEADVRVEGVRCDGGVLID